MSHLQAKIAPSILSADFGFLYEQCKLMIDAGADSLHIDIMDGHFVPNLTFGAPVVSSLRKHLPDAYLDCHLMVTNPQDYVLSLKSARANSITFHYEADHGGLQQICEMIQSHDMRVGMSVRPKTEITPDIEEIIRSDSIDLFLVMTVQPGFGGQSFMPQMLSKIKYLRSRYPALQIQADGGINQANIELLASHGANSIVSGSGIFGVSDKQKTISLMRNTVKKYLLINV